MRARAIIGRPIIAAAGLLWAAAASAAPGGFTATGGATATGTATAQVIAPLSVEALSDLDFGVVSSHRSGQGSVTISGDAGVPRYRGGAFMACEHEGECASPHPARFVVRGESGRAYIVAAPATLRIRGTPTGAGDPVATAALEIDQITVTTDSRPRAGPRGTLDARGRDGFGIGGTLRVPAGLPAARYQVTMPVVVTYG